MSLINETALVLALAAGLAYFNHFVLRWPRAMALTMLALVLSLILHGVEVLEPSLRLASALREELDQFNFSNFLLGWALGFLLFAGAVDVDARELWRHKWTIIALATVGVVLSTAVVAGGMYLVFQLLGLDVPIAVCLVFGALISPTDPVAILGVLNRVGIPRRLTAVISGESLFNDAVGIVLYVLFLQLASAGPNPTVTEGLVTFVWEAGGGALLGLATGAMAFVALRFINEYNIELMISLVLVTGTYGVAQTLGVSGPVAVSLAGLIMGSVGAKYAVSDKSMDYLQKFWSMTNEVLNAVLFLLIGLEFATIDLSLTYLALAALAVPVALLARGFSIAVASLPLNLGAPRKGRAVGLLTWSGLRGAVSVALVLALPSGPYREPLIAACYGVVIFTMIVQGLSLGRVAARLYPMGHPRPPPPLDRQ